MRPACTPCRRAFRSLRSSRSGAISRLKALKMRILARSPSALARALSPAMLISTPATDRAPQRRKKHSCFHFAICCRILVAYSVFAFFDISEHAHTPLMASFLGAASSSSRVAIDGRGLSAVMPPRRRHDTAIRWLVRESRRQDDILVTSTRSSVDAIRGLIAHGDTDKC